MQKKKKCNSPRLPEWLKRPLPKGEKYQRVVEILNSLHLNTVCSGAACPNLGECYSQGKATFMIMGDTCTRSCRFCAVDHGAVEPLEDDEPQRLAEAVKELGLKYVVITSVTRDDLADGGAEHFARTIQAVRKVTPEVTIEVLTPDFKGAVECLDVIYRARPDVFNHNLETVRRITPQIRSGADYDCSLGVLGYMAEKDNPPTVKSGLMVGLGETREEINEALGDMRGAGVQMVTVGQYLRPSKENCLVQKFYTPEEFEEIRRQGEQMGFVHVAAGPFVRSSYNAEKHARESVRDPKGD